MSEKLLHIFRLDDVAGIKAIDYEQGIYSPVCSIALDAYLISVGGEWLTVLYKTRLESMLDWFQGTLRRVSHMPYGTWALMCWGYPKEAALVEHIVNAAVYEQHPEIPRGVFECVEIYRLLNGRYIATPKWSSRRVASWAPGEAGWRFVPNQPPMIVLRTIDGEPLEVPLAAVVPDPEQFAAVSALLGSDDEGDQWSI